MCIVERLLVREKSLVHFVTHIASAALRHFWCPGTYVPYHQKLSAFHMVANSLSSYKAKVHFVQATAA